MKFEKNIMGVGIDFQREILKMQTVIFSDFFRFLSN